MTKSLAVCLVTLAVAAAVFSTSPGTAAAQQPGAYWLVIVLKIELIPGRPMMQLAGPFASATTCQGALAAVIDGLKAQGIEPASQACRSDVTVTLP